MAIKVTTSKGAYFFNHPVLQSLGGSPERDKQDHTVLLANKMLVA